MGKTLVAVFDNETDPYQGLRTIKDLDRSGDITRYSSTVIARDITGTINIKQEADPRPLGAAAGIAPGILVGLLGGPVGLAMGASLGGSRGLLFDLGYAGVDATFLDDVSKTLTDGRRASRSAFPLPRRISMRDRKNSIKHGRSSGGARRAARLDDRITLPVQFSRAKQTES